MDSETKLVAELWDYFRDVLPAGKRQDAAIHLLRVFQENGIEIDESELEGEDEYLDEAMSLILEDEEDLQDADWEDED